MQESGVGVIGFGFIGRVHAHAHLSLPLFYDPLPLRTRLTAVCAPSESSRRRALLQAPFVAAEKEVSTLLARDDVQLVHICTPNDSHADVAIQALAAGKHVYCDKPLARTLAEAESIAAAAAASDRVFQLTYNYRFLPATMRARELVEDGILGRLLSFRVAYLHAGYVSRDRPWTWRTSFARSGGGACMDLGTHAVDLLRYLTGTETALEGGGEIEAVTAVMATHTTTRRDADGEQHSVDVDDLTLATLRLEGGAVGSVEASRIATGAQDELRLELHGEAGAIRFNLMEPGWLDVYDNRLPEAPGGGDRGFKRLEAAMRFPPPYQLGATKNPIGWLNSHIHSVYRFVENVARSENGLPVTAGTPTVWDGLAAQRVIDACLRSAAEGGVWVSTGSDAGRPW